jgi:hypothetical protein
LVHQNFAKNVFTGDGEGILNRKYLVKLRLKPTSFYFQLIENPTDFFDSYQLFFLNRVPTGEV